MMVVSPQQRLGILVGRTTDSALVCARRLNIRNSFRCQGDGPAYVGSFECDGYSVHAQLGGRFKRRLRLRQPELYPPLEPCNISKIMSLLSKLLSLG
jgi:hypothetical protein